MDWWKLTSGAGAIFVGIAIVQIISSITEEERIARINWLQDRNRLERTIDEHRRNISLYIDRAQQSIDYQFLVDLHYSSHRVADHAYALLTDARKSINTMHRILDESKMRKEELKKQLDYIKNYETRKNIKKEIHEINKLRRSVIDDLKKVKSERSHFENEVKKFNKQTRELKLLIRDRCGEKGSDWYNRLEQRKRQRR
jgi:hypothetical protein